MGSCSLRFCMGKRRQKRQCKLTKTVTKRLIYFDQPINYHLISRIWSFVIIVSIIYYIMFMNERPHLHHCDEDGRIVGRRWKSAIRHYFAMPRPQCNPSILFISCKMNLSKHATEPPHNFNFIQSITKPNESSACAQSVKNGRFFVHDFLMDKIPLHNRSD